MTARVKICGVTQVEDAAAAWEAGADAIGLHFWNRSPRLIGVADGARIAATRPEGRALVGVFRNAAVDHIRRVVREVGLTALQLHGDEPPSACEGYGVPVVKTVRIGGPDDVRAARAYVGKGDVIAVLVRPISALPPDAGIYTHWQLAQAFHDVPAQLVLGGGLRVENVADAIRVSGAYAVDVVGGVEAGPGIKDREKVRAFIAMARQEPTAHRLGLFG